MRIISVFIAILALLTAFDPVAAQGSFEPNVNRPGGDYHSFAIRGGPEACQATCDHERACAAWTYVRRGVQGPSAMCWLKSSVPRASGDGCCVSGVTRGGGYSQAPRRDEANCCPNNMLVCPAGRHFCASPEADARAGRGQPYNPAWQAAPGDTRCCPNSMLVCPTPRRFCAR